jgi:small subunit ribosomal protein S1
MSDDRSMSEFAALFESSGGRTPKRADLRVGARAEGVVVKATRESVFLELDAKRQAWIDAQELTGPDGVLTVKVGDTVAAHVIEVDGRTGAVKLGRSLGKKGDITSLEIAREQGLAVEGKVMSVNKGGAEVHIDAVRAFCPTSQLDNRYVADPQSFVGKTLRFRVTEIREGGRNVVLSRRAVVESEAKEAQARILKTLAPGAAVKGTVSGIRDFGAFIDLGGAEGLIPASELSHDSQVRPGDVLKLGDVVDVAVKELREKDGEVKITLSLKALSADPWSALAVLAPVGKVLAGSVSRIADFGAFVRIAAGIEGLLHVSELPKRNEHPSKSLEVGQAMMVVVKSADAATRKVSLALAPDGAQVGGIAQGMSLVVGSIVKVTVEKIESFGLFVTVDGSRGRGGRGLVPSAELGLPRGADLRKHYPEGASFDAKVLETGEGRLRLSVRKIRDDEERAAFEGYRSTAQASGKATLGDLLKGRAKR